MRHPLFRQLNEQYPRALSDVAVMLEERYYSPAEAPPPCRGPAAVAAPTSFPAWRR